MPEHFIPPHGGYKTLLAFQKSRIVFDGTKRFCQRFLDRYDRTVDQMVQAARSGKQNILEASQASGTSKETEIKLTNVARASLEELLEDYHDFLRTNGLRLWEKDSREALFVRRLGARRDTSYGSYTSYIETRPAEVVANILVCLIHQTNYLLDQLIRKLEQDFLAQGGMRERLDPGKASGARERHSQNFWRWPEAKALSSSRAVACSGSSAMMNRTFVCAAGTGQAVVRHTMKSNPPLVIAILWEARSRRARGMIRLARRPRRGTGLATARRR